MQINTQKSGFQEAFDELVHKNREKVLSDLQNRLGVTLTTVNNKKAGRTKIKKTELPIIKAVFRKYGIEIN